MTEVRYRIEVTRGGTPDAATRSAIERAVAIVMGRRDAADAPEDAPRVPAWRRAALREGVGGVRATRPDRRG